MTRSVIVVKVYSPPVEGKATEEARKLLAEVLGVPRASVTIRSGARSRLKVFDVDGITDAQLDEKLRRR